MPVLLMTDIENSSEKWERYRPKMGSALARHGSLMHAIIKDHEGTILKHTGDGVLAYFTGRNALACALDLQHRFMAEDWGDVDGLRIRVGLHVTSVEIRGRDFSDPAIGHLTKLLHASWGGQILFTAEVKDSSRLPEGASINDLGVHQFSDLTGSHQILELSHPGLPVKNFPPIRTLSNFEHNLPIQATEFVGRTDEIVFIKKLTVDQFNRIICIVGSGGVGKTRLALQVAAELAAQFRNGVFFVPLTPSAGSSIQIMLFTIGDAIRFTFSQQSDPRSQLLNYLREKEMLLVIDNFEYSAEAVKLVDDVVETCPKIKYITTARERPPAKIKDSYVYELRGLEVPVVDRRIVASQSSAVRLFLQSAQRVNPDFVIDDENLNTVIEICRLAEGLPLALELAAAWVRTLSGKEIYQELGKNVDFLTTTMKDVPKRHRSIRAVFDYSWDILSGREKTVLMRLSLFQHAFQPEAAQFIAESSVPELTGFVDKSLLRWNTSGTYEMQFLLRQYIAEKFGDALDDREATRRRFGEFYAHMLHVNLPAAKLQVHGGLFDRMNEDIENIRTAWNWAVAQGWWYIIEMMYETLFYFYYRRAWLLEGMDFFGRAYDRLASLVIDGKADSVLALKIGARYGCFCRFYGDYKKALALLDADLKKAREDQAKREIVFCLEEVSNVCLKQGRFDDARQCCEDNLKVVQEIEDKSSVVRTLTNLGSIAYYRGNYEEARWYYEESLKISQHLADKYTQAICLNNLGNVYVKLLDYNRAREFFLKASETNREIKNNQGLAANLNNLADLAYNQGLYDEALRRYEESLAIKREIGDRESISLALCGIAEVYFAQNRIADARKYLHDGLEILNSVAAFYPMSMNLTLIAEMYEKTGEYNRARRILVFLKNHPGTTALMLNRIDAQLQRLKNLPNADRETADRVVDYAPETIAEFLKKTREDLNR